MQRTTIFEVVFSRWDFRGGIFEVRGARYEVREMFCFRIAILLVSLSILAPRISILVPRTSYLVPRFSILVPRTSHLVPRFSILVPRTSYLAPRFSILVTRTSHLAPRFSILVPRTSYLVPRTSHLAPRTSHLVPRKVLNSLDHDIAAVSDYSIAQVYRAVGDGGQLLVVGDDDEGLAELVAEVEEQPVEFLLVLRVERA